MRFLLAVRKFFCDEPTCPRKIFTERLAPFVAPSARMTARLFQLLQTLGLATGGRLGGRVTDRMGIQTTRHTILRRIMALPTEPVGQVPQIGIDDFSFRRGRTCWDDHGGFTNASRCSMCFPTGRQTLQPPGWQPTQKLRW